MIIDVWFVFTCSLNVQSSNHVFFLMDGCFPTVVRWFKGAGAHQSFSQRLSWSSTRKTSVLTVQKVLALSLCWDLENICHREYLSWDLLVWHKWVVGNMFGVVGHCYLNAIFRLPISQRLLAESPAPGFTHRKKKFVHFLLEENAT